MAAPEYIRLNARVLEMVRHFFAANNPDVTAAWPAHPAWLAQFLALLGTRVEL